MRGYEILKNLATNLGVGGSNPSGRANLRLKSNTHAAVSARNNHCNELVAHMSYFSLSVFVSTVAPACHHAGAEGPMRTVREGRS